MCEAGIEVLVFAGFTLKLDASDAHVHSKDELKAIKEKFLLGANSIQVKNY